MSKAEETKFDDKGAHVTLEGRAEGLIAKASPSTSTALVGPNSKAVDVRILSVGQASQRSTVEPTLPRVLSAALTKETDGSPIG